MARLTIKQLHAKTGEWVRQAACSRTPLTITDRGVPIAVLANPSALKPKGRKRVLLPEYEALLRRAPSRDVLDDLDAVRGDR
ncbi:hypothetical protein [Nibricoccus sp. IMCC34717]|uniref:hypothetical protein n=1 Tax=Nibricoccus sp. IMCC34717 TaxID=3034021 RepID=UPI00384C31B0